MSLQRREMWINYCLTHPQMQVLGEFRRELATDQVTDLDFCFYEISFQLLIEGLKMAVSKLLLDPILYISYPMSYLMCNYFIFSKGLSLYIVAHCTAVYRSKWWKTGVENWMKSSDIRKGVELRLFCLTDTFLKMKCHKTLFWVLWKAPMIALKAVLCSASSELKFLSHWCFID